MLSRMPNELVALVVGHAVIAFLPEDRAVLVHLAQTSKAMYELVAPGLYARACITNENFQRFLSFCNDSMTSPLAARVFRRTRMLCITADDEDYHLQGDLFTHLEEIFAPSSILTTAVVRSHSREVPSSSGSRYDETVCTLQRLHLWMESYCTASELSTRTLQNITHFSAYMIDPEFGEPVWDRFSTDPRASIRGVLADLPSLTDLGFYLHSDVDDEYGSDSDDVIVEFDLDLVAQALREALTFENGRLRNVSVRVTGQYLRRWEEILCILRVVAASKVTSDQRLCAWLDHRVDDNWSWWTSKDFQEGRSIWTEARPVEEL